MRLKLPATNLSYVILCVKYVLNGEECACNMHLLNDNKQSEVEIDTPDGAVVTTVTMNEVTNAQKVISIQVLYDSTEDEDKQEDKQEDKPTNSNLKVETKVEATIERKEHGKASRTSGRQESKSSEGESSKSKEKS